MHFLVVSTSSKSKERSLLIREKNEIACTLGCSLYILFHVTETDIKEAI